MLNDIVYRNYYLDKLFHFFKITGEYFDFYIAISFSSQENHTYP